MPCRDRNPLASLADSPAVGTAAAQRIDAVAEKREAPC
jgi:hypothetical protein